MSAEAEKIHVRMRASVGALRSQGLYWLEPDRAQRLIERNYAEPVAPAPAPAVDVVAAIEQTAELTRARHKLEGADDGEKSDPSAGKARTRSRAGHSNGRGDQAGRLDKPADGEPG